MAEKEGKQLKYIRVKRLVPACPDCGKELLGDNSFISPYKCSDCKVTWHVDWEDFSLYFKKPIVEHQNNKDLVERIFKD